MKQLERKGEEVPPPEKGGRQSEHWTANEHERFLVGLSTHGRQWVEVAKVVRTKTLLQVHSHATNYFKQLEREGKADLI
eukprot:CAMPEP_0198445476 /NCGR_PEP_ID=MMETSP1453-20131121/495_1 /TAXON_ID=1461543 ORGANISM="Unidentified sp., Strain RCC701" /NCGR_SAMPLE_ID=MMETSP1453 /ASSEMBLY_ACC=CAM_ASM_001118 /LENGTH=78 /DNA_ID=CAMNT_0044166199 /DNA_START=72 /DNA_END=305 /DNA_ORIENTATION=-